VPVQCLVIPLDNPPVIALPLWYRCYNSKTSNPLRLITMPSMTRRTARSETRDGQSSPQGDGIGVGSTQGPTEPSSSGTVHNSEVDVHQPMTLRQMQDIVDNQLLSTEQLRILSDRIRELLDARTGQLGKRTRFESDGEDDRPRKRRADHDLKYNNIKELKIGATLKAWSDWKIEIQRAFDAAP
jgi:hypothetical protein